MSLCDHIKSILTDALTPIYLKVTDFSESHKGHSGYREKGESHFNIVIVSNIFEGKSRIERQKVIYSLLATELRTKIHALTLKTMTVNEAEKKTNFST